MHPFLKVAYDHGCAVAREEFNKQAYLGATLIGGGVGALTAGEGNRLTGFAGGAALGAGGRFAANRMKMAPALKASKEKLRSAMREGTGREFADAGDEYEKLVAENPFTAAAGELSPWVGGAAAGLGVGALAPEKKWYDFS